MVSTKVSKYAYREVLVEITVVVVTSTWVAISKEIQTATISEDSKNFTEILNYVLLFTIIVANDLMF